LAGVSPVMPAAGGDAAAMQSDIKALFAGLAANGAGKNAVLVCAVPQAVALALLAGSKFDVPFLASTALPAGTVIAIDTSSFVSGFGSTPSFSTSNATVLHEEDTTPLPLADGALALPQRSLFQTDTLALKMTLFAAWGMRAAGHVQFVAGASW
jgi:hypothetical protein